MRQRHTREVLDLVARIREAISNVQLSTDDRWLPRGDGGGFRGDAVADRDGRYHSMFSFKCSGGRTRWRRRMPDDVSEADKTRRIVAAGAQRSSIGPLPAVDWIDAHAGGCDQPAAHGATGRTSGNTVVNFPGPPDWLGKLVDVTVRRTGPSSIGVRRSASRNDAVRRTFDDVLRSFCMQNPRRTTVERAQTIRGALMIGMNIKGLMVDPITNILMSSCATARPEGAAVWVGVFEPTPSRCRIIQRRGR